MMKCLIRYLSPALIFAVCVTATTIVRADDNEPRNGPNRYVVTPLTSDLLNVAPNTDPVLQNAWGVAFTPGASPFWIADNATGCSTLYDGTGVPQPSPPLLVKIPLPGGGVPSTACQTVNPKNPNPPDERGTDWPRLEPHHDLSRAEYDQPGDIHLRHRRRYGFGLDRRSDPT